MMLSPGDYYQCFLKNRTAEEIRLQIQELKKKINCLKHIMRQPDYVGAICPSEEVQVAYYQAYLELAKMAQAEAEKQEQE